MPIRDLFFLSVKNKAEPAGGPKVVQDLPAPRLKNGRSQESIKSIGAEVGAV